MGKFLYITCSLLLAAQVGHAQTAAQPGYIVTLAGDTARGVVASQGGGRAAHSCRFKPAAQAEFTTYAPTQLRAYGTATYAYQTYAVASGGQAAAPQVSGSCGARAG